MSASVHNARVAIAKKFGDVAHLAALRQAELQVRGTEVWPEYYARLHDAIGLSKWVDRKDTVARRQRRAPIRIDIDPDRAADIEAFVQRAVTRQQAIQQRIEYGYIRHAGFIPGTRYSHQRIHLTGLPSSDSAIKKRFVATLNRADNLLSGYDKAVMGKGMAKILSLDEPYVVGNQDMRGFLRLDIDQDLFGSEREIRRLCRVAGVPVPNFAVGWHDKTRNALSHPHFLYVLADSVCFTPKGHAKFMGLWWRVMRGLVYALLIAGADPGGMSNPMRTKNPLSPLWTTLELEGRAYSLSELAQFVRTDVTAEEIFSAFGAYQAAKTTSDTPRARRCSNGLFLSLKDWCRAKAPIRRLEGVSAQEWLAEVRLAASRIADNGMKERQVQNVADRVAEYTWKLAAQRIRLTAEQRAERRAEGARIAAAKNTSKTMTEVIDAALALFASNGEIPSKAAVIRRSGRTDKTVALHWNAVIETIADHGKRSLNVKKTSTTVTEHEPTTSIKVVDIDQASPSTMIQPTVIPFPFPARRIGDVLENILDHHETDFGEPIQQGQPDFPARSVLPRPEIPSFMRTRRNAWEQAQKISA